MLPGDMNKSLLTKPSAGGLLEYFEPLNDGGESYLKVLAFEVAKRKGPALGSTGKSAREDRFKMPMRAAAGGGAVWQDPVKPTPSRRIAGRRAAERRSRVDKIASSIEKRLGPEAGELVRDVHVFRHCLNSLVESWLVCRPDAVRWRRENPALWATVQGAAAALRFEPFAFSDGVRLVQRFDWPSAKSAESVAARLFLQLVTHPLQGCLRRCPRCEELFVEGRSDKKCCSDVCTHALTAKKANAKRRRELALAKKLRRSAPKDRRQKPRPASRGRPRALRGWLRPHRELPTA